MTGLIKKNVPRLGAQQLRLAQRVLAVEEAAIQAAGAEVEVWWRCHPARGPGGLEEEAVAVAIYIIAPPIDIYTSNAHQVSILSASYPLWVIDRPASIVRYTRGSDSARYSFGDFNLNRRSV